MASCWVRSTTTDEDEVDAVAGCSVGIADAARDGVEELLREGRDGEVLRGGLSGGRGGGGALDGEVIGAAGLIEGGLIDGDEEVSGNGGATGVVGSDEEGAGGGVVADASDEGAASGVVDGEALDEVGEAAGESGGAIGGCLLTAVLELAGGGDGEGVSGAEGDAGIDPSGIRLQVELAGLCSGLCPERCGEEAGDEDGSDHGER